MLKGVSNITEDEYFSSSIFVLPSYHEGLPIVILEAQQACLPCVAFQSCNGPNDLISDGVDGFLVDDSKPDLVVTGLADKLRLLMSNESLRIEMGEKGRLHAQDFSKGKVVDQWEAIIKSAHQNRVV